MESATVIFRLVRNRVEESVTVEVSETETDLMLEGRVRVGVSVTVVESETITNSGSDKKSMADPRLQAQSMPFDGKRLIYGGFKLLVTV